MPEPLDPTENRPLVVNERNVALPAGLFIAAAAMLLGFSMWLNDRFSSLDKRMSRIEDLLTDQWTVTQQELWAERLGRSNPNMNVPPIVRRP